MSTKPTSLDLFPDDPSMAPAPKKLTCAFGEPWDGPHPLCDTFTIMNLDDPKLDPQTITVEQVQAEADRIAALCPR
jgi:hypothetical protein